MKIKIIILITNAEVKGGTTRIISELVWNLHEAFDISVLTLEGQESVYPYPDNVRILRAKNFLAQSKSRLLRTIGVFLVTPQIARIIKNESPMVVMSFLPRPNLSNIFVKKFFFADYKCIITEQNYSSIQFKHNLAGRIFMRLLQKFYPMADLVIANARDLAEDLKQTFNVPESKLKVIYSPFDLEKIESLSQQFPEHPWFSEKIPVLLHAARLIEQKNQLLLLKAFSIVNREIPCRLIILGDGPLEKLLKVESNTLGVGENVAFLGWQDNIFKYMHHATAFILSSNYEGLPSVLVQAMACGCPVISTDCPSGPREILENGNCGILVPVGDVATLSRSICDVLMDSNLRESLSLLGQERARFFDIKKIRLEYLNIL